MKMTKITYKIGESQGPFVGVWENEEHFFAEMVGYYGHRKDSLTVLSVEDATQEETRDMTGESAFYSRYGTQGEF